jgi:integrase
VPTYRKRESGRWQAVIRRRGVVESDTFETKGEAQAWARRREAQIDAGRHGGTGSLIEAMDAYERDVVPHKRGARWEEIRLRKLRKLPFAAKPASQVTPADITAWAQSSGLAPASIRREASLIGSVYSYARRGLQWDVTSPIRDAVLPPPPKARTQRLSDEQIDALVAACGYERWEPPQIALHRVALALLFAVETAMRAGEICSITAASIHKRHVHLPQTKNGDARDVPLSAQARQILELLPDGFGLTPGVLDALFRRARDAAATRDPELAKIHFHDSRREAATRLAKKLDVMELARMGGWRNVNVLYKTYYAPSIESLADKL